MAKQANVKHQGMSDFADTEATLALAKALLPIIEGAGREILRHYTSASSIEISTKEDRTPLTAADLASHDFLLAGLQALTPHIPVLSEESAHDDSADRHNWEELWLVDPLDGTREFIDANDQFCVNVALIRGGVSGMGIVHSPVRQSSFVGVLGLGAWRVSEGEWQEVRCRPVNEESIVLICGSRRFNDEMLDCEDRVRAHFGHVKRQPMGSAIKYCEVAAGRADIYPCFGPTGEWDTAAGQAIVESCGGMMLGVDFKPFRYNQRDTLLNDSFYLLGDAAFNWREVLDFQD